MNRADGLRAASSNQLWDVVVIGGGATGLGTALDAASRGYRTIVIEQADFAQGTSSRSTKLSHGGVRYLQQGNIALVLEALKERGRMLHNAPHLVRRQGFVIPAYAAWEVPFYGIGLKTYDALSRGSSFGRSRMMSASSVREMLPTIEQQNLSGGVLYFDGQFDDARYALALAQTLVERGGIALNYTRMTRLLKRNGIACGVCAQDEETGEEFELQARAVINATGVFTDEVRRLDEPTSESLLTVSQGSHFVLPKDFLPGNHALMIPKTADGRVLFAIPWHGAVVVGTTDDPVNGPSLEPHALPDEKQFLAHHIELYFSRKLKASDVLSMWSGLRPLVRKQGAKSTAALSREHTVLVAPSKMVSITGGKWTTYRRMAEDTVNVASRTAGLPQTPSKTQDLRLHGWCETDAANTSDDHPLSIYGSDQILLQAIIEANPALSKPLHPRLNITLAQVVLATRHEMARTIEDVLARRTRTLFLDARAAMEAAPLVAEIMATELHRDESWKQNQLESFTALANGYLYQP